jgi:hypothetical protein
VEEDPLTMYDSLGIDRNVYEALQRGDIESMIWSMLLEQNPDPLFATVVNFMRTRNHAVSPGTGEREEASGQSDPLLAIMMNFMNAGNHAVPPGIDGQGEAKGQQAPDGSPPYVVLTRFENEQLNAIRATLCHVTRMLGACSACCGEDASCLACHGRGKPGSVPSAASAHEFRAWIEPALGRMGMLITHPAVSAAIPNRIPGRPQAEEASRS